MKIKLVKLAIVFLIVPFFTSCIATHMGTMSGSASLNAPNFTYNKKDVSGVAKAVYVLGIGGVAKESLIIEAKKNMLRSNPLLQNQALANVTVSYKSTGFLGYLITTVECTVSADIVEFGTQQTNFSQSPVQNVPSEIIQVEPPAVPDQTKQNNTGINTSERIKVGDEVRIINYFSNPVTGKVIEIQNDNYVVEYTKSNNRVKQVKVPGFQIERIK